MRADTGSPREMLTRYQRATVNMDADTFADLYAVDGVHELPFLFPGLPTRYEGREQIRTGYAAAWSHSPARPERIEELAVYEAAEVIVCEQVVHGTLGSGARFEFPGVLTIRVRDGRILLTRDYMDGLRVAHTMGRLDAVANALRA